MALDDYRNIDDPREQILRYISVTVRQVLPDASVRADVLSANNVVINFQIKQRNLLLTLIPSVKSESQRVYYKFAQCLDEHGANLFELPALKEFLAFSADFSLVRLQRLIICLNDSLSFAEVTASDDVINNDPNQLYTEEPERNYLDNGFSEKVAADSSEVITMTRERAVLILGAVSAIAAISAFVIVPKFLNKKHPTELLNHSSRGLVASNPTNISVPRTNQIHPPLSTIVSSPSCPTFSIAVTRTDRGILPVLTRAQSQYPQLFTIYHFTPRDLVQGFIRPRHIAEQNARQPHDNLHRIGLQRGYHFGRVVAGDQIVMTNCPTGLTITYNTGDSELYGVTVVR